MSQDTRGPKIEVHIKELSQLFDSMDPSPFHEKDLDRNAEEYIVAYVKELHPRKPSEMVVYLDQAAVPTDEVPLLQKAIREHFGRRAELSRWELRRLLRRGATSLVIGLCFLATALIAGELAKQWIGGGHAAKVIGESLHIGGWVAMWHPMEIFLYEWWPLLGQRRTYELLGGIDVRIVYTATGDVPVELERAS